MWVPRPSGVKVAELVETLLVHLRTQGQRSVDKLTCRLKPVGEFFAGYRAVEVTSKAIALYTRDRLSAGRAPATINRELEGLRQAFNHAAKMTPPLFPRHRVPGIPMLPVDNVRPMLKWQSARPRRPLQREGDCDEFRR